MGVRTYTSAFQFTENPISEAGIWTSGGAVGLDWTDVRTTPGKVFGTESGTSTGPAQYDDSVAVLKGPWGNDQGAEGVVFIVPTAPVPNAEIEILLRFNVTPHLTFGYEFNISCSPGITYATIVRWNGALGDFTNIAQRLDINTVDGDILAFTAIGSTLTAYKNGASVLSGNDTMFPSGAPGVGFFLRNQTGNNDHYGLSRFACNDGGVIPSIGGLAVSPAVARGSLVAGWA